MTEEVQRYLGKLDKGARPFFFEQNERKGIILINRYIMEH